MADPVSPGTSAPGDAGELGTPTSPSNINGLPTEPSKASKIFRDAQQSFSQSRPPVGMFHAFGSVGSNIPTLNDIQKGNFNSEGGWSGPGQRRNSQAHRDSDAEVIQRYRSRTMSIATPIPETKKEPIIEEKSTAVDNVPTPVAEEMEILAPHDPAVPYANGYQFPPKHSKKQASTIALRGFAKFIITPFGFLLTVYALNIVAWGGMLFLILIHATPAMAHPSYNALNSGAKIWLEITAQILNALFCVTGLGLIPWRFRDWYYLLQWRWGKDERALRRLAGIHRGWFRLVGRINEAALALPVSLSPDAPLTGERAGASKYWMLDFVIWAFIMLCGFMWGYNRYKRPGAAVGALISLACIVASAAGWVIYREGKRVKAIEGVPVSEEDRELLKEMREKDGGGCVMDFEAWRL
ncbi:hypothetical protein LSUB1_G000548 [Lachnellula subtilissima]|uniref:Uncharacterized protein n=1 Tax=Lachnellula subtilissima TaxID=602034 RepID=A0A8H8UI75_9HELO|nr:hypothetical protein LSUB1_G000548 [Lachnellula subtilissima]